MSIFNIYLIAIFYMGFPWLFGWIIFRFCCWILDKEKSKELKADIAKFFDGFGDYKGN